MFGRRQVASLASEFLGTGVLTLIILSVQRSNLGLPFFVASAAGLTIVVLMFVFGSASGTYFNPALTLAFWTARKLSTLRALAYIIAQFLGAYAAFGVFTYYSNTHLQSVGGHYTGRILIAEAVATGIFSFGFAATVYQGFSRSVNAAFAGLAYTVGVIAASSAALGLLNPALALGVRAWVWGTYVMGPVLGAIIGVNLYGLLFAEPEALATSSVVVSSPVVNRPVAKRKSVKK